MLRSSRFRFALALWLCLVASLATGCKGWRPQQPHDVAGYADPNQSYAAVLETLKSEKYTVINQDLASHTVRVRSHVDEGDASKVSVILVVVDANAVHLSASGYLVHPDGSTHHLLNSELGSLQKQLQKRLGATKPASTVAASQSLAALPPPPPPSNLPLAWSEPSADGHGNFTCLPVKLADEEQSQLTLKLSNGETADVQLALAHGADMCRSRTQCKVAGGCPALGIADSDRVSRLAARLSKHEVGPLATLISRGQPIVTIDLSKHGSIAQAMVEKH